MSAPFSSTFQLPAFQTFSLISSTILSVATSLQCWQSYSLRNHKTGKLQNLAPKFGATGRELIFEEDNFSGNLQDLIENLHTLNILASNITQTDKPNLNKDSINTDKGRSIEEDFVFNNNALESVDNLEDYKDDLSPIYGIDDPNNIIDIDDVVASVTIRVDDNEEEIKKENKKDTTKQDTSKEMKEEMEANAGEGLLKENETEDKGKWVWKSGKTKRMVETIVENNIGHIIVRDSEMSKMEMEGEDIDGQDRVKRGEGVEGGKGTERGEESKRAEVKEEREDGGQRRGKEMRDGSDREGGVGRLKRVEQPVQKPRGIKEGESERAQAQFQGEIVEREIQHGVVPGYERKSEDAQRQEDYDLGEKRERAKGQFQGKIVEREIQQGYHGYERKSEEMQREIQLQENFDLGQKRERVRRQVLDAVLVPCKTGQLCIISGNIESGIVADCTSKELQEANICQEKDDFFTCVCNSDGCNQSREKAATSVGLIISQNSDERQSVKSLLAPTEGSLRAGADKFNEPLFVIILAAIKPFWILF